MLFDRIVRDLSELNANLYGFAMWTEEQGLQFHRFQPCTRCHNGYSVAKTFTTTAIGLLWDEGKLDTGDSLGDILHDPAWKNVTIEHALTHRIGYGQGHLDIDVEDVNAYPSQDYLQLALNFPRPHAPGSHFQYTDAGFYLLSRAVDHVCGEKMDSFLRERLIEPLRFQEIAWSRCPMDFPMGATGLYPGAEDNVQQSALYLNKGVWQGQRILSEAWVDLVETKGYELTPMSDTLRGKMGMYGQGIAYSRTHRAAFAWHAFDEKRHGLDVKQYLADLTL